MLSICSSRRSSKSINRNNRHLPDGGKRRLRTPWLDNEIQNLIIGVYNYGVGKWAIIHNQMAFQKNRTYIDLKDKWRNLVDHRHCARTSAVYRAIASYIQKEQQKHGFAKPDKLVKKDDWPLILQKFYRQMSSDVDNPSNEKSFSEDAEPSWNEEQHKNEVAINPPTQPVKKVLLPSLVNLIPVNMMMDPIPHFPSISMTPRKVPTFQDLLW